MSKKPVNFYQGAKGTFVIHLYSAVTSDFGTVYSVDKKFNDIKQAIEDGFVPVLVEENQGVTVYHFEYDNPVICFNGKKGTVTISNANVVEYVKDSGGSGEDTSARDSYIVFLSQTQNGILAYKDGETDVPLLPSDIPADTGLISITYVEPDSETPLYNYYSLGSIKLDTTTLSAKKLIFYNYEHGNKTFSYNSDAGGFRPVLE